MAVFPSKPWKETPLNKTIKKYPGLFGVPFVLIIVAASYGLSTFTQTRYDLHDQKVKQRLNAVAEDDWEPKRIQRPKGLPEWGVPPPEPPPKKDGSDS
ncbi:hypothetical protein C0992_003758 [Termitomyces sp. T32_za158]|nr:hypothetical protein C0992_003758 [Termitomyces sp. T32_za158]